MPHLGDRGDYLLLHNFIQNNPGSNRRIDGAITLIDRLRNFLIQGTRERTGFEETIRQLTAITKTWDEFLNVKAEKIEN